MSLLGQNIPRGGGRSHGMPGAPPRFQAVVLGGGHFALLQQERTSIALHVSRCGLC